MPVTTESSANESYQRAQGLTTDRTLRVVLATDSPGVTGGGGASLDQNLVQVKGVAVSTGAGATDAGTIRVCLSSESAITLQTDQVNLNTDQLESLATAGNASLSAINTKTPALGTALIAASTPVNIASNQTVPVSVASLPLPSGASTSALQTSGNASLTSIDGKITAVNTGAVVVASSALPAGAATSGNQTSANASLTSIDGKITAVNTGAVVVASSALPSGAATDALQTSGNASLTSIDGKITAVNTGAVVVASSALPSGAATSGNQSTEITHLSNISGKLPSALGAQTTAASLAVNVASDQKLSVQGSVAADAVSVDNPALIGGFATRSRQTGVSADNDVASLSLDRYGRPRIVGIGVAVAVLDASASGDTAIIAAPGAGSRLKIIKVEASNTHASTALTVGLKSTSIAGGVVFGKKYLPAAGGQGSWSWPGGHITLGDNENISVNLSAAGTVSFTIYYETILT